MAIVTDVGTYFLETGSHGLFTMEAFNKKLDPLNWAKENKIFIDENLMKYGGTLLRNFNISSVSEFNCFVQILCPNLLDYTYRSTPRTRLGGKIYTATEYPADRTIPLHNENAYSRSWPQRIVFYSVIVASEGGETPIADSRKVYKKIDTSIKNKFEKHGILYVRNYSQGIDLSWQEVFQTENKSEVEQYCHEHNIDFQWKSGTPLLTTRQICQATVSHPVTEEKVWFNQAHLFHLSALDDVDRLSLIRELGEENVPRNTFYGDDSPMEIEALKHIRQIYDEEKIKFQWQKKDLLILDNLLMAHGREPYKGERKIVVAMA